LKDQNLLNLKTFISNRTRPDRKGGGSPFLKILLGFKSV
jgi:hypothetical protein